MKRRAFASSIALLVLFAVALAAGPKDGPPPSPPVPRVSLMLTDGSSVAGDLISATPAGITVRPNARAEPKLIPWRSIKRAGNGMTREQVVEDYRANHADQLCGTCKGSGTETCPTCDGKGVQADGRTDCAACNGTGFSGPCKTKGCVDGQIPCPMTCLKPDDFKNVKPDAAGKRWKTFRGRNMSFFVSDGHIGDLIAMENGNPVDKGKCPKCGGTSHITDPACKGTGKVTCATCHGHGVVGKDCPDCDDGITVCRTCAGTGMKSASTQPTQENAAPAAG